MNPLAFDLLEPGVDLAPWLETQLVEHRLAELVAELAAIHQVKGPPADSLGSVIGAAGLQGVLENGLKTLASPDLRKLILQPYHLLELQEYVLTEGGPYWRQVPRSPATRAARDRSWETLRGKLKDVPSQPVQGSARSGDDLPWASASETQVWYRRPWPWLINLATAAAVFVAVYFAFRTPPDLPVPEPSNRLVWLSPTELSRPASTEAYWRRLATVKPWWFSVTPGNKVELAMRMGQLSEGCSVLILHGHDSLSPADRERLAEKCRSWAKELNQYIVELQADNADVPAIQKKTDAWVDRVAEKLQYGLKG